MRQITGKHPKGASLFLIMSVSDKINAMLWNRRYVQIPNGIHAPDDMYSFLVRDATLSDRNYYAHMRDIEMSKCSALSVPTEGQIFEDARLGGYWTDEDQMILDETKDHLTMLNGQLDVKGFAARKKMIRGQILRAEKKFSDVLEKEYELKALTSEYRSHEVACYAFARRVICCDNDELLWPTDQAFIEFRDEYPSLVHFIVHDLLAEGAWDMIDIREIARSPEWRLIWCLRRNCL